MWLRILGLEHEEEQSVPGIYHVFSFRKWTCFKEAGRIMEQTSFDDVGKSRSLIGNLGVDEIGDKRVHLCGGWGCAGNG